MRTIHWTPLLFALACITSQSLADYSLSGTVTLTKESGKPVEDRSGIVVFLEGEGLQDGSLPSKNTDHHVPHLSHAGSNFSPAILPIVKGSRVDFLNDDDVYHNAFSLSKAKPFDLGIYPQGKSKIVEFEKSGLVRVYCNIHPNMTSSILVLNNPFYATTDKSGYYKIEGIPPGEYSVRAWGNTVEDTQQNIALTSGNQTQNFALFEKKRFKKHSNKFGKPYRSKY